MSKEQYVEAFSKIYPSEESIERIIGMTEKRHFVSIRKTLVILAAVIAVVCSMALIANAATDGAVSEAIDSVISSKMAVLVNGKEIEYSESVSTPTPDGYQITVIDDGVILEYDVATTQEATKDK